jgi:hypothetical protein
MSFDGGALLGIKTRSPASCPLFNRQSDVSFHPQGSKHMMVVRLQTITNKLAFIQYRNQSRIIF